MKPVSRTVSYKRMLMVAKRLQQYRPSLPERLITNQFQVTTEINSIRLHCLHLVHNFPPRILHQITAENKRIYAPTLTLEQHSPVILGI